MGTMPETMCLPAVLQGFASDVLHGVPKPVTHKIIGALGHKHLVAAYCNQLITWTQILGESLREFATAIGELPHRAFPALCEGHIHRGPGNVFSNGIGDQGIKQHYFWVARRHSMRPSGTPQSWES
jgi:hypothetical protein